jgi:hypothetical protein
MLVPGCVFYGLSVAYLVVKNDGKFFGNAMMATWVVLAIIAILGFGLMGLVEVFKGARLGATAARAIVLIASTIVMQTILGALVLLVGLIM